MTRTIWIPRASLTVFMYMQMGVCLFNTLPAAESDAADQAARTALSGVWCGYAVDGKGEKPDQGPVKMELQISTEKIHGIETKGDQPIDHGEGTYVFDLAAEPQQLDGTKTNERGRKETWLGIYKLEGDTLYWCVGRRERPETFETVKGQFLLIMKRDKPATD